MTYKQAVVELKDIYDNALNYKDYVTRDAFNKAIEALEKQIPNKPIFYGVVGGHPELICPNCEHNYVNNKYYCDRCGQAIIDWENKNGE